MAGQSVAMSAAQMAAWLVGETAVKSDDLMAASMVDSWVDERDAERVAMRADDSVYQKAAVMAPSMAVLWVAWTV